MILICKDSLLQSPEYLIRNAVIQDKCGRIFYGILYLEIGRLSNDSGDNFVYDDWTMTANCSR
jgi:hypothetical protein